MNERSFLKQLNCKANKDGDFTYTLVYDLINPQNESVELKKTSKISHFFRKIFHIKAEKSPQQIIEDNFLDIIGNINLCYVDSLIKKLINNPSTKQIVIDNKKEVVNKLISDEIIEVCDNENFRQIIKTPEIAQHIEKNMEELLGKLNGKSLFRVSSIVKGYSNEADSKLEKIMIDNKRKLARGFMERSAYYRNIKSYTENIEELLDKYEDTLLIMIEELLESEKCGYIDIEYLNSGSYSDVYKIGDKVLKVGGPRETYEIPNHPRILQPLIRTNFIDENTNTICMCIEIADMVDKVKGKDITNEELYQIYKELRENGIIWADCAARNLGRLRRSNVTNLKGEDVYVFPNSVGFDKINSGNILNKGDLVIIDTDLIYKENANGDQLVTDKSEEFERKYQQEKARDIAKLNLENLEKNKNSIENNKER